MNYRVKKSKLTINSLVKIPKLRNLHDTKVFCMVTNCCCKFWRTQKILPRELFPNFFCTLCSHCTSIFNQYESRNFFAQFVLRTRTLYCFRETYFRYYQSEFLFYQKNKKCQILIKRNQPCLPVKELFSRILENSGLFNVIFFVSFYVSKKK